MDGSNPWGDEREVLALLGSTLLVVQTAEHVLRAAMQLALPKGGVLHRAELERQTNDEARKTLGYFLGQLRRRVVVLPEFDAELSTFLADRNRLVHHLDSVEGFNIHTPEGRVVAEAFLLATSTKAARVISVFLALMSEWVDQVGMKVEVDREAVDEMIQFFDPVLSRLFANKPE